MGSDTTGPHAMHDCNYALLLYAALSRLRRGERQVITVEYRLIDNPASYWPHYNFKQYHTKMCSDYVAGKFQDGWITPPKK